jgi:hypothetical protein
MPDRRNDRDAFVTFVEQLRLETFSMYERIRSVQRGDGTMCERLTTLGDVGRSAATVYAEVEELYAAVLTGPEAAFVAEELPEPHAAPAPVLRERVLAAAR